MMTRVLGELVTFDNSNGLNLDGIFYRDDSNKTTIIHVHGSFGNFYQNQFLRVMAKTYLSAGINLLSFNVASHDGLAEGYRFNTQFEYIGGAVTNFEECIFDIDGAIKFAQQFSDRIILQGHSLGCDRILHFLISKAAKFDFILLAPCDSYELHANWIAPETVDQQIARLKAKVEYDSEFGWLPLREYGIKQSNDWTYPIPITLRALLSIIDGPPFRLLRIKRPAEFSLNLKAMVCIGGSDALQVWPKDIMFSYFKQRIKHLTSIFLPNGDHNFSGCELEVAELIVKWVQTDKYELRD